MKYNARLNDRECVRITVNGSLIATVENIDFDASLPYILPPLVDLQQNGALGTYFTSIHEKDPDDLNKIAHFLRSHGVGKVQLTTTTGEFASLKQSMRIIDKKLSSEKDLSDMFFGIFQEGIFISPQDGWRGAHPAPFIMQPNYDKLKILDECSGGRITMVNTAPEVPGGLDFIERAKTDGKNVSLGHCCPDAATVKEAVKRGATLVTHFGNGAAPMIHRFRNPFWAFLSVDELRLGLICDGCHLPPELVSAAIKCKGRENCWVVSDASGYSGLPPGHYVRDEHRSFVIREDGFMHLEGREVLMGAWFQLDHAIDFLVGKLNFSFLDAWDQCSRTPAKIANIELSKIAPGETADFVLAHWDKKLVLDKCVFSGCEYPAAAY